MDAMAISLSGLDVEWRRLEVIAENLANVNTTRTAEGGEFHPRRLVSGPNPQFAALLQDAGGAPAPSGVQVMDIQDQTNPVTRSYDPNHPHADADGFITRPNIDQAAEMTLMIRTSRSYEANLAALSIARDMYLRALDIGKTP
jgi:flagellar basal-body rod protein FlgC